MASMGSFDDVLYANAEYVRGFSAADEQRRRLAGRRW